MVGGNIKIKIKEIVRLRLVCTIWWWQLECKDAWTPEFTDKFGSSVKIKSIQEETLVCTCFSSFINW